MTKKSKEDTVQADLNSRSASDELRQFIERYESLEEDKKSIAADQKEIMAEAKGRGYDTKVMRRIIGERKRDKDEIAEEESILELYREALGMDYTMRGTRSIDGGEGEGDGEGMV
jgi:uncharacterized protein (UPF0335 family)